MRFLVDAQLPRSLCRVLARCGHEAKHTLDLPKGNHTGDGDIAALADADGWIVVSKDSDFVVTHLLRGRPRNLLQISTGNISNPELEKLLLGNMKSLVEALDSSSHVEINRTSLIVHG